MKLVNKHREPSPVVVVREDFSGGLNLTFNADGIAENQLIVAENVEAERNTGRLKTVAGTIDVLNSNYEIFAAMYDGINKVILIVYTDKIVRVFNPKNGTFSNPIGLLNGDLYPVSTAWEDGLLIASGGKLQYYNGTALITLTDSYDSTFVYTRASRVFTTSPDNVVRFSADGDETNWMEDTDSDLHSQWTEVSYKDGGQIVGMINLANDVLIIKNNRRVFRLSGEFPEWQLSEVSRNVECSGRLSFCSVADSVFILGKNVFQNLQHEQFYGDVKAENVGRLVIKEIQKLPENAKVRYVPPLNQIWCIGEGGVVMMFDLNFNAWFKRKFNSAIIDVISIGDSVIVVKSDRISILVEGTFSDNDVAMKWKFQGQRLTAHNCFLLKRTQVSIIPFSATLYTGQVNVGMVRVPLPIPERDIKVEGNTSKVFKNYTKISLAARKLGTYVRGVDIRDNISPVFENDEKVFSQPTFIKESRNVYRSRFLDVKGFGEGGGFLLNRITFDVVEV